MDYKRQINFAIVGFGGIARTHALAAYITNLNFNLPYNLNLHSIVTRNKLDSVPNGVNNTLNIEEVLENKNIDFIDICTPNDSHKEIALRALLYNKPIYCEKPLTSNYEEALAMTTNVSCSGVKNAVALIYRFLPALRMLKEEIEEGTIGEIIDFKVTLYHKSYLSPKKKGAWRTLEQSGGGALLDLGIHLVDMIEFTLGEIENVKCDTRVFFSERTKVDEIAKCDFKLKNEITGSLEVSRIFAEAEEETAFKIYGSKGSIRFSSHKPYSIEVYNFESANTKIKNASTVQHLMKYYAGEKTSLGFLQDCHTSSLINFANLVAGYEENPIMPTFEDGLRAQRVVEACYKAAADKKTIAVETI